MYYWTEEAAQEAFRALVDNGISSAYIMEGVRPSDGARYWRVFY